MMFIVFSVYPNQYIVFVFFVPIHTIFFIKIAQQLSGGFETVEKRNISTNRPRLFIGVTKGLTLGGIGVWWLIDILIISAGDMKDGNGYPLSPIG